MCLTIIPLVDLKDSIEPRRIICIDKSGTFIIWALYDGDFDDDEGVDRLMKRPLIIRNAWVYFYAQFDELQFKASLSSAYLEDEVGDEPAIQRVRRFADTKVNKAKFKDGR